MQVPALVAGVVMFVAIGLALHYAAGAPAWASIVIPGCILGAVSGLRQSSRI
jgi:hypothetical protein